MDRRLLFVLLPSLLLAGCQVDVMTELEEQQAVDLIVLLRQNGIVAEKRLSGESQDPTWAVRVPSPRASDAFLILSENDRPRDEPEGFADLFGKSKFIPTETEEKVLFLQAQAGELAKTIESIPGVIDARVHIAIPEEDPLRRALEGERTPPPRAAVLVKHWASARGGSDISAADVRTLVAGSVERLDEMNVSVVLKPVVAVSPPPAKSMLDPAILFFPLSGFTLVLVILLIVFAVRTKSLQRQVEERVPQAARNAG
jgi:type III secretion protein J